MDDTTTQDLKKQFDALPPEVQRAITDADLSAKLLEIVKNNKLLIDQAAGLETATMLVLFGLEPLENYTQSLMKNVGLSSIQASVVAHDVNETIFKSVRDFLKQINSETAEAEASEKITDENKENEPLATPIKLNIPTQEIHADMAKEGIEIQTNNLPEIAPMASLPTSFISAQKTEPLHQNIPPIQNIVETKMTETVAVPKETIVSEEKTKLPEKPASSSDPYRETFM
jgi:hypothetical protein